MKILIANKFFFRNGGSEAVMFQERDYLMEMGHEVIDFAMHDERNLPSPYTRYFVGSQDYHGNIGKLGKIKSAVRLINSFEAARSISKLIEDTQPDILHCHNIYHQLTPSIIGVAKKFGLPVVLTLHDYKLVCPTYSRLRDEQPCSDCQGGDFFNVVINRCADKSLGKSALLYAEAATQKWLGNYDKVDTFIAPSRFMKESIAHRIPADRIRHIYNGVNIDKTTNNRKDEGYVLYLGRLSREKGVETLLKAHTNSTIDWPLEIAGTGPLESELKSKYENATFRGHLNGKKLQEIIDKAAVIVVPSEWYENCPMSVIEAMAHGKPVVGSRIGGIPELIEHEKTGLLFESGHVEELTFALEKLMSSAELRKEMGRAALDRVEAEFSIDSHNTKLINIYQSQLGKQG